MKKFEDSLNRREFLNLTTSALGAALCLLRLHFATPVRSIRATHNGKCSCLLTAQESCGDPIKRSQLVLQMPLCFRPVTPIPWRCRGLELTALLVSGGSTPGDLA